MIHSFLLIGQSNMAGRGFLDEVVPVNEAHIKVLRNGRWCNLHRPVHHDRHFSGVCLAESFAEKYAETYGVDVGLIPCADGGTTLNQWMPGTILFDHAVYMTRLAQRTSTVAGVLWHQGEGDCFPSLRATYRARFETMMAEMRRLLGLYDVPFIVGWVPTPTTCILTRPLSTSLVCAILRPTSKAATKTRYFPKCPPRTIRYEPPWSFCRYLHIPFGFKTQRKFCFFMKPLYKRQKICYNNNR